ncbi:rna exonuclease rex2 [Moniliophthora roreri MCA 2997]|uniref:Rna exonuclease rex2 n=1 Tax=Moniliophthora roreri (strain MCA 2997) TaxID=1381753 RepID=V2XIV9_MONRO|nr:rna exonuclease rex2 [Moniliophthora roreri MCA 2997]
MSFTSKQLTLADGPMVWIDCEMTGLDPETDKIMEIAVLITNGNLELVDEGIEYIVKLDREQLDRMGEWCTKQHGESGLTKACLSSPFTKDYVSKEVLAYIKKWIPVQRAGVLAGNSIHMDRMFLAKEMPEVTDWLHYRLIDVSSVKELANRWYPDSSQRYTYPKDNSHRALSDIKCSIEELKWYRKHIFVPPVSKP